MFLPVTNLTGDTNEKFTTKFKKCYLCGEGLNPYTSFLAIYFDKVDVAETFSERETRLSFSSAKNIQSTIIHPMSITFRNRPQVKLVH